MCISDHGKEAGVSTPERLVELQCPGCRETHWEIDCDFRGEGMADGGELSYAERTYRCPVCEIDRTGFGVLQKSPAEFFLQPHRMYPMSVRQFDQWVGVLREHFPDDFRLKDVGLSWYPAAPQPKDAANQSREDAKGLGGAGFLLPLPVLLLAVVLLIAAFGVWRLLR